MVMDKKNNPIGCFEKSVCGLWEDFHRNIIEILYLNETILLSLYSIDSFHTN